MRGFCFSWPGHSTRPVGLVQAAVRALEQQQAGMLNEFAAERQRREAQWVEERQRLEVCACVRVCVCVCWHVSGPRHELLLPTILNGVCLEMRCCETTVLGRVM